MHLIAINEIHRVVKPGKAATTEGGRGTPPTTETIKAGKPFEAEKDEGEDLISMGAARVDHTKVGAAKDAEAVAKSAARTAKEAEAATKEALKEAAAEEKAAKEKAAAEAEAAAKAAKATKSKADDGTGGLV